MKGPLDTHWHIRSSDGYILNTDGTHSVGVQGALGILAAINFCGLLTTFMIPETMGKSLEELNGELELVAEKDDKGIDLVGVPAESYA